MSIPRDDNQVPYNSFETLNSVKSDPGTFAGGTTDARGDDGGAKDGGAIFTVTGEVLVRIFGVCTTTLVGGATIEVGVAGNTASLIAQIADATDLITSEIWLDATPTVLGADLLANVLGPYVIVNGLDIIETITTTNITAGELHYICMWSPLSPDGNVVANPSMA